MTLNRRLLLGHRAVPGDLSGGGHLRHLPVLEVGGRDRRHLAGKLPECRRFAKYEGGIRTDGFRACSSRWAARRKGGRKFFSNTRPVFEKIRKRSPQHHVAGRRRTGEQGHGNCTRTIWIWRPILRPSACRPGPAFALFRSIASGLHRSRRRPPIGFSSQPGKWSRRITLRGDKAVRLLDYMIGRSSPDLSSRLALFICSPVH